MKEVRYDAPGPCLIMAWPKATQNPETVKRIIGVLVRPERMAPGQVETWTEPRWAAWVAERERGILERTQLPRIDHWWEPPVPGMSIGNEMMMTYYIDSNHLITAAIGGPNRKRSLVIDGEDVLCVWGYHCQVPEGDAAKAKDVLANFGKIIDVVRPPFALVDHYALNVKKRQDHDLRQHAWGVTVYGPALVKKLGKDTLLKAPAWKVEDLPWGGVWVQAGENPFTVDFHAKKAIEKHLGLRERFTDAGAATTPAKGRGG